MNIVEKLISDGIASNVFQATHIANGLKLFELSDEAEQLARARLYRDWRNAGEKSKVAYERAIRGDAVPAPMFVEALHTDDKAQMPLFTEEEQG